MNNLFIKALILLVFFNCNNKVTTKDSVQFNEQSRIEDKVNEVVKTEEGFLFVSVSKIYHRGGEIVILDKKMNPHIIFKDKKISINDKNYDIINDEHLYKDSIKVESYFPDYGLFIMEAKKQDDGFYEVQINNMSYFIDGSKYNSLLTFKSVEQFILEGRPYLTEETPLRVKPNDNAEIIYDYSDYTYLSVEIEGDWLKVKDDKDCYPGEEPSQKDIIGWVRWKKDGEIIIDIRHRC